MYDLFLNTRRYKIKLLTGYSKTQQIKQSVLTKYKILCLKYKQDNGKEENIFQFARNYVETEPFHKFSHQEIS